MKKSLLITLALCPVLVFSMVAARPAEDVLPPSLYLMADIQVEVAKAPEYEAALKALIAALKNCRFPMVFDTYATDDSRYYIIYGLGEGYSGIESLNKAWGAAAAQIGSPKFQALHARMTDCELGRVFRFWTFRTDLSFLPSPERLSPAEIGYYTWDYVWLVPGKEAEFEALHRDWISLSAAHKARDPFMTYQGGYGNEEPVYVWFEYGRSAADYALAEEKYWQDLGPEGAALSKRTRALIKKMETKTGRYRPDLSYAPSPH